MIGHAKGHWAAEQGTPPESGVEPACFAVTRSSVWKCRGALSDDVVDRRDQPAFGLLAARRDPVAMYIVSIDDEIPN